MKPATILTDRDRAIVDALAVRVRIFTVGQISRGFFGGDDRYAQRRIHRLVEIGLLRLTQMAVRSTPPLDRPLARWSPGDAAPAFQRISSGLIRRWTYRLLQHRSVVTLGPRADGPARRRKSVGVPAPFAAGHDLALGELFLRFISTSPERGVRWIGEAGFDLYWPELVRSGGSIPDAVIQDAKGNAALGIEIGGLYSPARLSRLHATFKKQGVPYELW